MRNGGRCPPGPQGEREREWEGGGNNFSWQRFAPRCAGGRAGFKAGPLSECGEGGGRNQAEEPTSSSSRLSLEHIRADIQPCTRCATTGRGTNPGHGHAPRGWVRPPPPPPYLHPPPSVLPLNKRLITRLKLVI